MVHAHEQFFLTCIARKSEFEHVKNFAVLLIHENHFTWILHVIPCMQFYIHVFKPIFF